MPIEKIAQRNLNRTVNFRKKRLFIGEYSGLSKNLKKQSIDITDDYNDWIRIGFAFAREFDEEGWGFFIVSGVYRLNMTRQKQYNVWRLFARRGAGESGDAGKFFHLVKESGVTVQYRKIRSVRLQSYSKFENPDLKANTLTDIW